MIGASCKWKLQRKYCITYCILCHSYFNTLICVVHWWVDVCNINRIIIKVDQRTILYVLDESSTLTTHNIRIYCTICKSARRTRKSRNNVRNLAHDAHVKFQNVQYSIYECVFVFWFVRVWTSAKTQIN